MSSFCFLFFSFAKLHQRTIENGHRDFRLEKSLSFVVVIVFVMSMKLDHVRYLFEEIIPLSGWCDRISRALKLN